MLYWLFSSTWKKTRTILHGHNLVFLHYTKILCHKKAASFSKLCYNASLTDLKVELKSTSWHVHDIYGRVQEIRNYDTEVSSSGIMFMSFLKISWVVQKLEIRTVLQRALWPRELTFFLLRKAKYNLHLRKWQKEDESNMALCIVTIYLVLTQTNYEFALGPKCCIHCSQVTFSMQDDTVFFKDIGIAKQAYSQYLWSLDIQSRWLLICNSFSVSITAADPWKYNLQVSGIF